VLVEQAGAGAGAGVLADDPGVGTGWGQTSTETDDWIRMKDMRLRSEADNGTENDRPYWQDLRYNEKHLSQHNLSLPYLKSRTGRYLYFEQ
jgi:hypothetical protein